MIEFAEYFLVLLGFTPALALWAAVIVFAALWLRRSGGKAERFLLAGASLKLLGNLLGIPMIFIFPWLVNRGYELSSIGAVSTSYSIFLSTVSMAGIICLVYAFWVKFIERKLTEAKPGV